MHSCSVYSENDILVSCQSSNGFSKAVSAAGLVDQWRLFVDGETGYLRSGDVDAFAEAMAQLVSDLPNAQRMGEAGRRRIQRCFAMTVLDNSWNDIKT